MSESEKDQGSDFVDRTLHSFDHVLDLIHDRVLRPILLAGRAIAFSFIIVVMSVIVVSALLIGIVRLCNVYFFAGHEWITYAIVGAAALITGLIIWRRRRPVNLRK